MIETEEAFELTLEQLTRAYRILAGSRRDVAPRSRPWYRLMAEGPLDLVRQLQGELEQYLSVGEVTDTSADLWLVLEGVALESEVVPFRLLFDLHREFDRALRSTLDESGQDDGKGSTAEREWDGLWREVVLALRPGQPRLGLTFPATQERGNGSGESPVRSALQAFLQVAAWVDSDAPVEELIRRCPDPTQRAKCVLAVARLAGSLRSADGAALLLRGRAVPEGRTIRLTPEAEKRIAAAHEPGMILEDTHADPGHQGA